MTRELSDPLSTEAERAKLLDTLETILKTECDPERRKYARRRYLDLTDERKAAA